MSGVKLNSQQVAYAGENFVAAEIHRRGGYAVTFSGNMKGIDLLASDVNHERKIDIQVKTKTGGAWQITTNHAESHSGLEDDGRSQTASSVRLAVVSFSPASPPHLGRKSE